MTAVVRPDRMHGMDGLKTLEKRLSGHLGSTVSFEVPNLAVVHHFSLLRMNPRHSTQSETQNWAFMQTDRKSQEKSSSSGSRLWEQAAQCRKRVRKFPLAFLLDSFLFKSLTPQPSSSTQWQSSRRRQHGRTVLTDRRSLVLRGQRMALLLILSFFPLPGPKVSVGTGNAQQSKVTLQHPWRTG